MDNLGWDNTTVIRNDAAIQQGLWSSQYGNFSEANTDCSSITSGRGELDGSLFTSTLDLQGIQVCDQMNSSFVRVNEMLQKLVPNLDWDLIPRQELVRMATNSVLSSGITTWEDPLHSQLCSFPSTMICPDTVNATPGIFPKNYEVLSNGVPSEELEAIRDIRNDEGGVLLPSIFSRGENIQTLSCSGTYNVSSGESESHSSNWKDTASQASSNPDSIRRQSTECKRKLDENSNQHPCNVLQSSSSTSGSGFQVNFEDPSRSKKPRLEKPPGCSSINFQPENAYEPDVGAIAQVKDMIYRAAALRPLISLGVEEVVEKPRRKNVRISSDPQTVAARQRRERISDRLRVLQKLVPGGSKMDTASMLDEAANYLKFLKSQVGAMETPGSKDSSTSLYPTHFSLFPCRVPFSPIHNPNPRTKLG